MTVERLLHQKCVARILGVEVDTLASWRRKGIGPRWYRVIRGVRYRQSDVEAWLDSHSARANRYDNTGREERQMATVGEAK